jgi:EmrB/QacA subfamily drug resistance transporter
MQYKWTVLTVTTVGVLMSGIDSRIVIVGLPQVAAALGADAEQAIWFTQAYVLASTMILLLIGRLTDIVGRVKIYNIGFAIFTVGSALTSIAMSPIQVIIFRAVQGLGSAFLFTNSVALIADSTPRKELGLSLGINQIAFRFGAMAGLTISGAILSILDWRALFYINIPVGIFGTIWAHRRLKEVSQIEKGAPFDLVGFVLFSVSLLSFLLALTFDAYGITELLTVIGLGLTAVITFVSFIMYERRVKYPVLDFKLFRIREFTGGVISQMLNAIAWGGVMLLLSLYLQLVLGLSALDTGVRIVPFELAFLVCGPLSGKFSDKFGQRPFILSGLTLTSLSLFLLSTTSVNTSYNDVVFYMVVLGAGIGMFSSPNISSVMGSVPAKQRGVASAVRAIFFNVGFTISLNLAILIMSAIIPYSLVSSIISSADNISLPLAEKVLFAQALSHTFFWMGVLNTAAVIPSLLRGKGSKPEVVKLTAGFRE